MSKIVRKNGRKFRIWGRKFCEKKVKNDKFYFAEVEALARPVPDFFAFCMLFMNFCFKN